MKIRLMLLLAIITLNVFSTLYTVNAISDEVEGIYTYNSTVMYINKGDGNMSLDEGYMTLNLFLNTSWQTVYLTKANHKFTKTIDYDENPVIVLDVPSILPRGNVTLSYSLRVLVKQKKSPLLAFSTSWNLSNIPSELQQQYCKNIGSWPVDNKTLGELAYKIAGGEKNVLRIVTSLANWIGENIVSQSNDLPLYPTETYDLRKGDCDDKANLLITLSRIVGIPAYLQVGLLQSPSQNTETYWDNHVTSSLKHISYHGWAIIYVPPWGWIPFDMTLGWRQSDSLAVVTSAPIWNSNSMQMMNVTKSDWAGDGRKEKEEVTSSTLYIQSEDELVREGPESWFQRLLQEWYLWITITAAITAVVLIGRNYMKKHRTTPVRMRQLHAFYTSKNAYRIRVGR